MSNTNPCSDSGLTFEVDGSYLLPYENGVPLEPIDLTDLIQAGETNTRLQLDNSTRALVYTGEQAMNGSLVPDTIPLESIFKLVRMSDLQDVSYNGVVGGDLLVYNATINQWEPRSVLEDTVVSIIGIGADGKIVKQAIDGLTGGGGGDAPSRVQSIASTESIVPDPTNYDQYSITAQAGDLVVGSPGTSSDGKTLILRIKDNGTVRNINWNAIYRGIGVTIPGQTIVNKVTYVGMKYNSQDNKWDVLAVGRQA